MRGVYKPGVLIFLLALLTPTTVQLFSDRERISIAEKRTLAPMPLWPRRWSELSSLPGELDRFAQDHFGLREPLTTGWSLLKYALRYTPRVEVGREGWLYLPQHWDSRYGGRACSELSEGVRSLAARLGRLAAYAAQSGVPVVFAVGPDKETLYPEYLAGKEGASGRCELRAQLAAALGSERAIKTVDLQAKLEAWKPMERVYFKTDSHWSEIGAWHVARVLLESTCTPGSACPRLPRPALSTKTFSGDLAGMIGLASVLREQIVAVEVPAGKRAGRTLYVVGDSFARRLLHFLAADESVAAVRFADHKGGSVDFRPIVAAKPDAILIMVVERYLYDPDLLRSLAAGF